MKKLLIFGFVFILLASFVSATPFCGDGTCDLPWELCPDCEDECIAYCSDEGMIYEVDCPEGTSTCLGTCIDETSRTASDDFCTGRGYIDEDDCPGDCTEAECRDIGFITPIDCTTHGYVDMDEVLDECEGEGFIRADECPEAAESEDDCWGLGYIPREDCTSYLDRIDIDNLCRAEGYSQLGETSSSQDSGTEYLWIILVIIVGIYWYYKKK